MPLFMDLHKASDYEVKPTLEEIKRNHIADLNVQHKYGVKFLQYWINEEAGLVFCLMEAPDKESCAAVHQEAHGNMPCNVIELKGGDYQAFAGDETRVNEFDIVEKSEGILDAGYRMIMVVDFISLTSNDSVPEEIGVIVKKSGGHFLNRPINRKTIVFMPGSMAIECADAIIQHVQQLPGKNSEVRIGLSAGEPVTDQQDIFSDAIQLANQLCDIAQNGQLVISSQAKKMVGENVLQFPQERSLKILDPESEQFLKVLSEAVNLLLFKTSFNIDSLCNHMGMSRSQLYRRIKQLTGYSANSFVQELRMQKALHLIKNKYGNVTQVALESGFSNLSYFAKSFQKRFGILPLKAAKLDS